MDLRHKIKTGDIVLFSGNTPTGFLLRTFVSSQWNHSGIAFRFHSDGRLSFTEEGDLHIFETNTGSRIDSVFGDDTVGAGFSEVNWVFGKYNRCAVRKLKEEFRLPELEAKSVEFIKKYRGAKFPSESIPFLQVWLGIPLTDKKDPNVMFCSELMARYYAECVGPIFERITGTNLNGDLRLLFGSEAPEDASMITPGHYAFEMTPSALILQEKEEEIFQAPADLLFVIIQPLLIILVIMLAVYMTLPKK